MKFSKQNDDDDHDDGDGGVDDGNDDGIFFSKTSLSLQPSEFGHFQSQLFNFLAFGSPEANNFQNLEP